MIGPFAAKSLVITAGTTSTDFLIFFNFNFFLFFFWGGELGATVGASSSDDKLLSLGWVVQ